MLQSSFYTVYVVKGSGVGIGSLTLEQILKKNKLYNNQRHLTILKPLKCFCVYFKKTGMALMLDVKKI